MKIKNIAAVLAALMCIGLAGCSNNTSDEVTTSAETSETTEAPDTEASQDDTEGAGEDDTESAEGETAENPLQHIADAGLAAGEWPALWEVDDDMILEDFFLLDASNENYRNMIVLQCPMSANMTELIIIEANDVEAAKADLEARQKKAQEKDAWYPDDIERAGASIVGTEGDYAYFIMCAAPDEVEKAITDYIRTL